MLIADRYELGDIIGTGGMSDVYAATDVSLGREVAVKMLKIDMARDENFRERFRREAQNSARLTTPTSSRSTTPAPWKPPAWTCPTS